MIEKLKSLVLNNKVVFIVAGCAVGVALLLFH